jgi:hypothetical protein
MANQLLSPNTTRHSSAACLALAMALWAQRYAIHTLPNDAIFYLPGCTMPAALWPLAQRCRVADICLGGVYIPGLVNGELREVMGPTGLDMQRLIIN